MKNSTIIFASIAYISIFALPVQAATMPKKAAKPTPFVYTGERIFYFTDTPRGLESVKAHLGQIDILAPQSYAANASGTLLGSVRDEVHSLAAARGTKLMPLIVNQQFSMKVAHALLTDPQAQTVLANALVAEALSKGYIGWQLDLEHIDAADRDLYTQFVGAIAAALHNSNLVVSVAVNGRVSDNPGDYPDVDWQEWIGAFDYPPLANAADFLSIMAYDEPNSAGPVASLPWYRNVLAYALSRVPKEKVSFGVPLYGWEWNVGAATKLRARRHFQVKELFDTKRYTSFAASEELGVPWVFYYAKKKPRIIWYENAASFEKKMRLLADAQVRGFSAWVLGGEDARIWNLLPRR